MNEKNSMSVAVWERHKSHGDIFLEYSERFQRLPFSDMTENLACVQLSAQMGKDSTSWGLVTQHLD